MIAPFLTLLLLSQTVNAKVLCKADELITNYEFVLEQAEKAPQISREQTYESLFKQLKKDAEVCDSFGYFVSDENMRKLSNIFARFLNIKFSTSTTCVQSLTSFVTNFFGKLSKQGPSSIVEMLLNNKFTLPNLLTSVSADDLFKIIKECNPDLNNIEVGAEDKPQVQPWSGFDIAKTLTGIHTASLLFNQLNSFFQKTPEINKAISTNNETQTKSSNLQITDSIQPILENRNIFKKPADLNESVITNSGSKINSSSDNTTLLVVEDSKKISVNSLSNNDQNSSLLPGVAVSNQPNTFVEQSTKKIEVNETYISSNDSANNETKESKTKPPKPVLPKTSVRTVTDTPEERKPSDLEHLISAIIDSTTTVNSTNQTTNNTIELTIDNLTPNVSVTDFSPTKESITTISNDNMFKDITTVSYNEEIIPTVTGPPIVEKSTDLPITDATISKNIEPVLDQKSVNLTVTSPTTSVTEQIISNKDNTEITQTPKEFRDESISSTTPGNIDSKLNNLLEPEIPNASNTSKTDAESINSTESEVQASNDPIKLNETTATLNNLTKPEETTPVLNASTSKITTDSLNNQTIQEQNSAPLIKEDKEIVDVVTPTLNDLIVRPTRPPPEILPNPAVSELPNNLTKPEEAASVLNASISEITTDSLNNQTIQEQNSAPLKKEDKDIVDVVTPTLNDSIVRPTRPTRPPPEILPNPAVSGLPNNLTKPEEAASVLNAPISEITTDSLNNQAIQEQNTAPLIKEDKEIVDVVTPTPNDSILRPTRPTRPTRPPPEILSNPAVSELPNKPVVVPTSKDQAPDEPITTVTSSPLTQANLPLGNEFSTTESSQKSEPQAEESKAPEEQNSSVSEKVPLVDNLATPSYNLEGLTLATGPPEIKEENNSTTETPGVSIKPTLTNEDIVLTNNALKPDEIIAADTPVSEVTSSKNQSSEESTQNHVLPTESKEQVVTEAIVPTKSNTLFSEQSITANPSENKEDTNSIPTGSSANLLETYVTSKVDTSSEKQETLNANTPKYENASILEPTSTPPTNNQISGTPITPITSLVLPEISNLTEANIPSKESTTESPEDFKSMTNDFESKDKQNASINDSQIIVVTPTSSNIPIAENSLASTENQTSLPNEAETNAPSKDGGLENGDNQNTTLKESLTTNVVSPTSENPVMISTEAPMEKENINITTNNSTKSEEVVPTAYVQIPEESMPSSKSPTSEAPNTTITSSASKEIPKVTEANTSSTNGDLGNDENQNTTSNESLVTTVVTPTSEKPVMTSVEAPMEKEDDNPTNSSTKSEKVVPTANVQLPEESMPPSKNPISEAPNTAITSAASQEIPKVTETNGDLGNEENQNTTSNESLVTTVVTPTSEKPAMTSVEVQMEKEDNIPTNNSTKSEEVVTTANVQIPEESMPLSINPTSEAPNTAITSSAPQEIPKVTETVTSSKNGDLGNEDNQNTTSNESLVTTVVTPTSEKPAMTSVEAPMEKEDNNPTNSSTKSEEVVPTANVQLPEESMPPSKNPTSETPNTAITSAASQEIPKVTETNGDLGNEENQNTTSNESLVTTIVTPTSEKPAMISVEVQMEKEDNIPTNNSTKSEQVVPTANVQIPEESMPPFKNPTSEAPNTATTSSASQEIPKVTETNTPSKDGGLGNGDNQNTTLNESLVTNVSSTSEKPAMISTEEPIEKENINIPTNNSTKSEELVATANVQIPEESMPPSKNPTSEAPNTAITSSASQELPKVTETNTSSKNGDLGNEDNQNTTSNESLVTTVVTPTSETPAVIPTEAPMEIENINIPTNNSTKSEEVVPPANVQIPEESMPSSKNPTSEAPNTAITSAASQEKPKVTETNTPSKNGVLGNEDNQNTTSNESLVTTVVIPTSEKPAMTSVEVPMEKEDNIPTNNSTKSQEVVPTANVQIPGESMPPSKNPTSEAPNTATTSSASQEIPKVTETNTPLKDGGLGNGDNENTTLNETLVTNVVSPTSEKSAMTSTEAPMETKNINNPTNNSTKSEEVVLTANVQIPEESMSPSKNPTSEAPNTATTSAASQEIPKVTETNTPSKNGVLGNEENQNTTSNESLVTTVVTPTSEKPAMTSVEATMEKEDNIPLNNSTKSEEVVPTANVQLPEESMPPSKNPKSEAQNTATTSSASQEIPKVTETNTPSKEGGLGNGDNQNTTSNESLVTIDVTPTSEKPAMTSIEAPMETQDNIPTNNSTKSEEIVPTANDQIPEELMTPSKNPTSEAPNIPITSSASQELPKVTDTNTPSKDGGLGNGDRQNTTLNESLVTNVVSSTSEKPAMITTEAPTEKENINIPTNISTKSEEVVSTANVQIPEESMPLSKNPTSEAPNTAITSSASQEIPKVTETNGDLGNEENQNTTSNESLVTTVVTPTSEKPAMTSVEAPMEKEDNNPTNNSTKSEEVVPTANVQFPEESMPLSNNPTSEAPNTAITSSASQEIPKVTETNGDLGNEENQNTTSNESLVTTVVTPTSEKPAMTSVEVQMKKEDNIPTNNSTKSEEVVPTANVQIPEESMPLSKNPTSEAPNTATTSSASKEIPKVTETNTPSKDGGLGNGDNQNTTLNESLVTNVSPTSDKPAMISTEEPMENENINIPTNNSTKSKEVVPTANNQIPEESMPPSKNPTSEAPNTATTSSASQEIPKVTETNISLKNGDFGNEDNQNTTSNESLVTTVVTPTSETPAVIPTEAPMEKENINIPTNNSTKSEEVVPTANVQIPEESMPASKIPTSEAPNTATTSAASQEIPKVTETDTPSKNGVLGNEDNQNTTSNESLVTTVVISTSEKPAMTSVEVPMEKEDNITTSQEVVPTANVQIPEESMPPSKNPTSEAPNTATTSLASQEIPKVTETNTSLKDGRLGNGDNENTTLNESLVTNVVSPISEKPAMTSTEAPMETENINIPTNNSTKSEDVVPIAYVQIPEESMPASKNPTSEAQNTATTSAASQEIPKVTETNTPSKNGDLGNEDNQNTTSNESLVTTVVTPISEKPAMASVEAPMEKEDNIPTNNSTKSEEVVPTANVQLPEESMHSSKNPTSEAPNTETTSPASQEIPKVTETNTPPKDGGLENGDNENTTLNESLVTNVVSPTSEKPAMIPTEAPMEKDNINIPTDKSTKSEEVIPIANVQIPEESMPSSNNPISEAPNTAITSSASQEIPKVTEANTSSTNGDLGNEENQNTTSNESLVTTVVTPTSEKPAMTSVEATIEKEDNIPLNNSTKSEEVVPTANVQLPEESMPPSKNSTSEAPNTATTSSASQEIPKVTETNTPLKDGGLGNGDNENTTLNESLVTNDVSPTSEKPAMTSTEAPMETENINIQTNNSTKSEEVVPTANVQIPEESMPSFKNPISESPNTAITSAASQEIPKVTETNTPSKNGVLGNEDNQNTTSNESLVTTVVIPTSEKPAVTSVEVQMEKEDNIPTNNSTKSEEVVPTANVQIPEESMPPSKNPTSEAPNTAITSAASQEIPKVTETNTPSKNGVLGNEDNQNTTSNESLVTTVVIPTSEKPAVTSVEVQMEKEDNIPTNNSTKSEEVVPTANVQIPEESMPPSKNPTSEAPNTAITSSASQEIPKVTETNTPSKDGGLGNRDNQNTTLNESLVTNVSPTSEKPAMISTEEPMEKENINIPTNNSTKSEEVVPTANVQIPEESMPPSKNPTSEAPNTATTSSASQEIPKVTETNTSSKNGDLGNEDNQNTTSNESLVTTVVTRTSEIPAVIPTEAPAVIPTEAPMEKENINIPTNNSTKSEEVVPTANVQIPEESMPPSKNPTSEAPNTATTSSASQEIPKVTETNTPSKEGGLGNGDNENTTLNESLVTNVSPTSEKPAMISTEAPMEKENINIPTNNSTKSEEVVPTANVQIPEESMPPSKNPTSEAPNTATTSSASQEIPKVTETNTPSKEGGLGNGDNENTTLNESLVTNVSPTSEKPAMISTEEPIEKENINIPTNNSTKSEEVVPTANVQIPEESMPPSKNPTSEAPNTATTSSASQEIPKVTETNTSSKNGDLGNEDNQNTTSNESLVTTVVTRTSETPAVIPTEAPMEIENINIPTNNSTKSEEVVPTANVQIPEESLPPSKNLTSEAPNTATTSSASQEIPKVTETNTPSKEGGLGNGDNQNTTLNESLLTNVVRPTSEKPAIISTEAPMEKVNINIPTNNSTKSEEVVPTANVQIPDESMLASKNPTTEAPNTAIISSASQEIPNVTETNTSSTGGGLGNGDNQNTTSNESLVTTVVTPTSEKPAMTSVEAPMEKEDNIPTNNSTKSEEVVPIANVQIPEESMPPSKNPTSEAPNTAITSSTSQEIPKVTETNTPSKDGGLGNGDNQNTTSNEFLVTEVVNPRPKETEKPTIISEEPQIEKQKIKSEEVVPTTNTTSSVTSSNFLEIANVTEANIPLSGGTTSSTTESTEKSKLTTSGVGNENIKPATPATGNVSILEQSTATFAPVETNLLVTQQPTILPNEVNTSLNTAAKLEDVVLKESTLEGSTSLPNTQMTEPPLPTATISVLTEIITGRTLLTSNNKENGSSPQQSMIEQSTITPEIILGPVSEGSTLKSNETKPTNETTNLEKSVLTQMSVSPIELVNSNITGNPKVINSLENSTIVQKTNGHGELSESTIDLVNQSPGEKINSSESGSNISKDSTTPKELDRPVIPNIVLNNSVVQNEIKPNKTLDQTQIVVPTNSTKLENSSKNNTGIILTTPEVLTNPSMNSTITSRNSTTLSSTSSANTTNATSGKSLKPTTTTKKPKPTTKKEKKKTTLKTTTTSKPTPPKKYEKGVVELPLWMKQKKEYSLEDDELDDYFDKI